MSLIFLPDFSSFSFFSVYPGGTGHVFFSFFFYLADLFFWVILITSKVIFKLNIIFIYSQLITLLSPAPSPYMYYLVISVCNEIRAFPLGPPAPFK